MNSYGAIYHQLTDHACQLAKTQGLLRTTRGDKGDDEAIIRTDEFLDEHVPHKLANAGVRRCHVIYGYIGDSSHLIDIETGNAVPVMQKAKEAGHVLLWLETDPKVCWVSDLDLYDAVKNSNESSKLRRAAMYWQSLQPFAQYDGTIRRPEVMIAADLPPQYLHEV